MYSKFRNQIKDTFVRCHALSFEPENSPLPKVCTMSMYIRGNRCTLALTVTALFFFFFKRKEALFQALEQSLTAGPALEYSGPFSNRFLTTRSQSPPCTKS